MLTCCVCHRLKLFSSNNKKIPAMANASSISRVEPFNFDGWDVLSARFRGILHAQMLCWRLRAMTLVDFPPYAKGTLSIESQCKML